MVKFVLGPGILEDTDNVSLFNRKRNVITVVCSGSNSKSYGYITKATFKTDDEAKTKFKELIKTYKNTLGLVHAGHGTWIVKDKIESTDVEYDSGCFKAGTYMAVIYIKHSYRSWLFRFDTKEEAIEFLDDFNERVVKQEVVI